MNIAKPVLSQHRRARLAAWALAMLMWMVAAMLGAIPYSERLERQRGPRMSLEGLKRMVIQLIVSRAAELARQRRRKRRHVVRHRGRDIAPRGLLRAVIGWRVRKLLTRKHLGESIAALIHALQHLDSYAALVAKRLKRGLTRRRLHLFALPPAPDARVITLARPALCAADTS